MTNTSASAISLDSIPAAKHATAQLVLDKFAAAGFGQFQQVAALANAIAESDLNPTAREAPPSGGVGLFILNRNGGLGSGHSVEELMDPNVNIDLVINEAKRHAAFAAATSLDQAVDTFVRQIERPANLSEQSAKRQKIAQKILPG